MVRLKRSLLPVASAFLLTLLKLIAEKVQKDDGPET